MTAPIKKSFYLRSDEIKLLNSRMEEFGLSGKGALASFIKKIIAPDVKLIFLESKTPLKIKIEVETEDVSQK